MRLFVGTSGYSYPEWKGHFYPADLSAKQMLPYYAERFSSVELNHTFYKMPKRELLEKSLAQVPTTFRFTVKAPMVITHRKRLKDAAETLGYLAEQLHGLGTQAGCLYFQTPPNLKLDLPRLEAFLQSMPTWPSTARGGSPLAIAFELAHPSWHVEETRAMLAAHGASFVVVDGKETKQVGVGVGVERHSDEVVYPTWIVGSCAYLRLRRPDYDDAALDRWIALLRASTVDEAYVYFKHEDAGLGPRFAQRFLERWAS